MSNNRWFAYDVDGFSTFATEEEAKAKAERCLKDYQHEAQTDGWDSDVELVCWGEIKECAVITSETPRPPAEELAENEGMDNDGNDWNCIDGDAIIDYGLKAVTP